MILVREIFFCIDFVYNVMNKFVKINYLLVFSWFIISFLVVVFVLGRIDFPMYPVKPEYYQIGIINIITAIICLYLAIRLRTRHQKTEIGEIIFLVLIMVVFLNIVQSIFQFYRFNVDYRAGIVTDPSYIFQQFFFNSSYYFLGSAVISFYRFTLEVFHDGLKQKENRLKFYFSTSYLIAFCIYLLKFTLLSAGSLELAIIAGILLLSFILIFSSLSYNAIRLRSKLEKEKSKERTALLYFGFTGIFLVISMVLNLVFNLLYESGLEIMSVLLMSNIFMLLGFICLYLGFTLPLKRK